MQKEPSPLSEYPQPEWNAPDSISVALESVAQARDSESSSRAYNKLLYAIGNNHAGTYFPVVLAVMPAIELTLRNGEPWPQRTVLEVLLDLQSAFCPENTYKVFNGVPLAHAVKTHIFALRPSIELVAKGTSIAASSAQELLETLNKAIHSHPKI